MFLFSLSYSLSCRGHAKTIGIPRNGDPTHPVTSVLLFSSTELGNSSIRYLLTDWRNFFSTTVQCPKGICQGTWTVTSNYLYRPMQCLKFNLTKLIFYMIIYIKTIEAVALYVADFYSKLTASISSKFCITHSIAICNEIFNGDSISLINYLIDFKPTVEFMKSLPPTGFQLKSPAPNLTNMPSLGTTI